MSEPAVINVIAQNLGGEARTLDAGAGQRRVAGLDETALRAWLGNFAALPALDAEDADARLHLTLPAGRLSVRWIGGRLGSEINGNFLVASVDEILAQAFPRVATEDAAADPVGTGVALKATANEGEPLPVAPVKRGLSGRARAGLLAASLAACAFNAWWVFRPATPDDTEWIDDTAERQAIFHRAAGSYASINERLVLDAAAKLTATNEQGVQTLATNVRAGRRRATTVLVTQAGVVIELAATGGLRIDGVDYRRL